MGFDVLVNQMQCIIANLPSGKKFLLNEIIADPPGSFGKNTLRSCCKW